MPSGWLFSLFTSHVSLYLEGSEGFAVAYIEHTVVDDEVSPVWTRTLGDAIFTYRVEVRLVRRSKSFDSTTLIVAIKHTIGTDRGTFSLATTPSIAVEGFACCPVDSHPVTIGVVDPVGTINHTIEENVTTMMSAEVFVVPCKRHTLEVVGKFEGGGVDAIALSKEDLSVVIDRSVWSDVLKTAVGWCPSTEFPF